MKISRYGTAKYHGVQSIELKKPSFSWSLADSCIAIKQMKVKDFSEKSNHNYTVNLSLDEIRNLLHVLSEEAVSDPVTFEKCLAPSLKPLLRLQAVVAGTVG